jgi:hypothetical protein
MRVPARTGRGSRAHPDCQRRCGRWRIPAGPRANAAGQPGPAEQLTSVRPERDRLRGGGLAAAVRLSLRARARQESRRAFRWRRGRRSSSRRPAPGCRGHRRPTRRRPVRAGATGSRPAGRCRTASAGLQAGSALTPPGPAAKRQAGSVCPLPRPSVIATARRALVRAIFSD